jgi:hypothetical protein
MSTAAAFAAAMFDCGGAFGAGPSSSEPAEMRRPDESAFAETEASPADTDAATPLRLTPAPALTPPAEVPAEMPLPPPTLAPARAPPTDAPAEMPPRPAETPTEMPPLPRDREEDFEDDDFEDDEEDEPFDPPPLLLPPPRPPPPPNNASAGVDKANRIATQLVIVFTNMAASVRTETQCCRSARVHALANW